jgi:uncharacterized protein YneF (UPF0154 family)
MTEDGFAEKQVYGEYLTTKKRFSDYSWLALPLVIFFLIGVVTGIWGAKTYFEHKLNDAVKMQRMVYKTVVYDIMPFESTVATPSQVKVK